MRLSTGDITGRKKASGSDDLFEKCRNFSRSSELGSAGLYMYSKVFGDHEGRGPGEVRIGKRKALMFGSHDYVDVITHPKVKESAAQTIRRYGSGCGGSRLLNGTLDRHVKLERELAAFVCKKATIIFGTGFQANCATLSALAERGDVMICGQNLHVGLAEGALRSPARTLRVRHSDLDHFERCPENSPAEEKILVISEGVFSMEGEVGHLRGVTRLAKPHGARLYGNEAHGTGVLGPAGATVVRGPVNPSSNYEWGMLIEGFDSSPVIMMTYNPRYYPALMGQAGLRKAKDLYAYIAHSDTVETEKIERVAERSLATDGVRVRPINMKDFNGDVEHVWNVYNSAWSRNWGFVPMSREEFQQMGKEMKQILKPELVLIGEVGNRVVGFALALPDINQALKPAGGRLFPTGLLKILYYQRLVKNVRVLALGVVEEYRASGLVAGFYATLVRNGRELGYGDCEMSWILEDNVLMNRSLEAMGAKRYKTYRIYEWN